MESDRDASMAAGNCPAPSQTPAKTWRSSKRGAASPKPAADVTSRFHGDGVRYKAKLIGVDEIPGAPGARGDKMCLDSVMKLKGQAEAYRRQGRHKQKVWLKVSSTGLKLLDERTGAVEQDHERGNLSSVSRDESDPRALSYVHHHQGRYSLYYIKTSTLADPVVDDIREICQSPEQEERPAESHALLILDEQALPVKVVNELDMFILPSAPDMFNVVPSSPGPQETSSRDDLGDIFSISLDLPGARTEPDPNQPGSPQQSLPQSPSLTLPPFPGLPLGVAPFTLPASPGLPLGVAPFTLPASPGLPLGVAPFTLPASPGLPLGVAPFTLPASTPWAQQGALTGFQPGSHVPWGAPAPWPPQPAMTGWPPAGMAPQGPPPSPQGCPPSPQGGPPPPQPYGGNPQPGVMWGQSMACYPTAATNYNYNYNIPYGGEGAQPPASHLHPLWRRGSPATCVSHYTQQPNIPYGGEGAQPPASPTTPNNPAPPRWTD